MNKVTITLTQVQALKVTNQCRVTTFAVVGLVKGLRGKTTAHQLKANGVVYATNVDITDYLN